MSDLICEIAVPKTPQELEQAIHYYRTNNLKGTELLCYWQAIRDAALEQSALDGESDRVPGEDSY